MKVAVFVEGGVVIGVTTDHPDIEVAVVDYDVDKTDPRVVTPDGEPCEIMVYAGDMLRVEPEYVAGLFEQAER